MKGKQMEMKRQKKTTVPKSKMKSYVRKEV